MRTDTGLNYLGKSPRWAIIHVTKKLNTSRGKTQLLLIKIIPNNLTTTSCVAKLSEVVFTKNEDKDTNNCSYCSCFYRKFSKNIVKI